MWTDFDEVNCIWELQYTQRVNTGPGPVGWQVCRWGINLQDCCRWLQVIAGIIVHKNLNRNTAAGPEGWQICGSGIDLQDCCGWLQVIVGIIVHANLNRFQWNTLYLRATVYPDNKYRCQTHGVAGLQVKNQAAGLLRVIVGHCRHYRACKCEWISMK